MTFNGKCAMCPLVGTGYSCTATNVQSICGLNSTLGSSACACITGTIVAQTKDSCILPMWCNTNSTVISNDGTHCILNTECTSAIDLTKTYCVGFDSFSNSNCGTYTQISALGTYNQCNCLANYSFVKSDGSGCYTGCGSSEVVGNGTFCYNGTTCVGTCKCQTGQVLQLNGTCT